MHIGLYFGSFNPIHIGHLIVANHIIEHTRIDKIWFVISPQNPLKETNTLLNEHDRLHLVNLAIENNPKFRASNIEFHLPKPSYTIDTLMHLRERFPLERFTVIMGSDSFQNITKWKNYESLLANYELVVYNRPGFEVKETHNAYLTVVDAPMLEISSSYIREQIKAKKSIKYIVPPNVEQYILDNRYYNK
jgi:nicotinate-nucleotide adenylyltransferase